MLIYYDDLLCWFTTCLTTQPAVAEFLCYLPLQSILLAQPQMGVQLCLRWVCAGRARAFSSPWQPYRILSHDTDA